jgi:SAM-dependent methyltransferase
MRQSEASHVGSLLQRLQGEQISPVLNLGSSTLHFRQVAEPHIESRIFEPLKRRGVTVVHSDLKAAPGVDIVGNIYDPLVAQRLRDIGAKLILCCNMLEHITDPRQFMLICSSLLKPGGKLLITVPYSYPYHPDPIDTYLRASPQQVASLAEGFEVSESDILIDVTYLHDLVREKSGPQLARHFASHLAKLFWPFSDINAWKARYHRYLWLFRRYKITCVLLTRE